MNGLNENIAGTGDDLGIVGNKCLIIQVFDQIRRRYSIVKFDVEFYIIIKGFMTLLSYRST